MSIKDEIDSSTLPPETDQQLIERLAKLPPLEYDRQRETSAEKIGSRVSTLDKQVIIARKESSNDGVLDELTEGIEPWHEPVSGGDLLKEIRETFNRYCALPDGADTALSLWTLASYGINSFRIFPKACLSSPEKRCGKTTTLEVIGALAHRSLMASNISASVLFRSVHLWQPSLLIDEADTFLHGNDELRGVINSGHTRSGAFVLRTVGDSSDMRPEKFSTWAPMVIAMIKTPPDTIRDRSIMVTLRRKLPGESVQKLPFDLADGCVELRQKCKRWADDNEANLKTCAPSVPEVGSDRAMDNWLPLLAIAGTVGGDWQEAAQAAMLKLENVEDSDEGIGPMILNDVREVFQQRKVKQLFSDDLVAGLVDMEERPWCEWKHGKPLTKNSLARLLRPFEIRSATVRMGRLVRKGYHLDKCRDAFSRYLPCSPPVQSVTALQSSDGGGCSDFQNVTAGGGVTFPKTLQPSSGGGCNVVTLQESGSRGVAPSQSVTPASKGVCNGTNPVNGAGAQVDKPNSDEGTRGELIL